VSGAALHWVRQQLAAEALAAVLEVAGRERIALLPVKGFVTARMLYAHVAERRMGDVDLRVRPRDLPRLLGCARRQGWSIDRSSAQLGTAAIVVGEVTLELETSVGPPFLARLSVEDLLARAEPARDPQLHFAYLAPEVNDHALLLAVNVFKDHLRSPPWALEDLARIARASGLDPALVARRAREAGAASAVHIVASAVPAWRAVADELGPPPRWYAELYARTADARPSLRALVAAAGADSWPRRALGAAAMVAGAVPWKARKWRGRLADRA